MISRGADPANQDSDGGIQDHAARLRSFQLHEHSCGRLCLGTRVLSRLLHLLVATFIHGAIALSQWIQQSFASLQDPFGNWYTVPLVHPEFDSTLFKGHVASPPCITAPINRKVTLSHKTQPKAHKAYLKQVGAPQFLFILNSASPQSGNTNRRKDKREMMEDLEVSSRLEFHGVAYVATVSVAQQQLHVQVEVDDPLTSAQAASATAASSSALPSSPRPAAAHEWTCWTGSFPSAYIEELTRKTGNFKRFPIFVNMLLSAICQRSDAVFIDLLTTSDLELYRKRKMGKPSFPQKPNDAFDRWPYMLSTSVFPSAAAASTANKRYLILTYAVEFDRVHYPLPLSLVQTPTPEILQRTVRRLRQALSASKGDSRAQQVHEELESLKEENRCLKSTLKQQFGAPTENVDCTNQQIDGSESPIDLQRELKATLKENKELIGIYQQLRGESSAEISKLKAEVRQLRLAQANDAHSHNNDTGIDTIRTLHKQLEQERSESRRKMNDSSTIVQETLNQLKLMKAQFDETQLKNRELLRQLAIARAKAGMNQASSSSARPLQARAGRAAAMTSSRTTPPSLAAPLQSTTRQRSAVPIHFRQPPHLYGESDDDEDGHTTDGDGASSRRQQQQNQRPFRRFDPTAYQQEKQRKLRMARSQSPHNSAGPNTHGRSRRGSNTGGGYTSDSSAGGGYSSAASSDSNRSSRRGRSRTRLSAEHQRAVAERLSSPKRVQDPDSFQNSTPRFRALLPRPTVAAVRASNNRGRSPSPAATASGAQRRSLGERASQQHVAKVLPPTHPRFGQRQRQAMAPPPPPPVQTKRFTAGMEKRATGKLSASTAHASALLAGTTADSFSDIDDRLNALQQFLKEAKQGSTGTAVTNKQAQTQA